MKINPKYSSAELSFLTFQLSPFILTFSPIQSNLICQSFFFLILFYLKNSFSLQILSTIQKPEIIFSLWKGEIVFKIILQWERQSALEQDPCYQCGKMKKYAMFYVREFARLNLIKLSDCRGWVWVWVHVFRVRVTLSFF